MIEQIEKLKKIEVRAIAIAQSIDVNDDESEAKYVELAQMANQIGEVINALDAN